MSKKNNTRSKMIGGENNDTEMREAYELWEEACHDQDLELTPAYDLTALTAIVNENSGTITKTEHVNDVQVDTWKMKQEKVNDPEEILNFKGYVEDAHSSNTLPTHLIILTDYGEETDDEVTCFMANLLSENGVKVTIIHTHSGDKDEFQKQEDLYKERGGSNSFITIDEITQENFQGFLGEEPEKNVILQIGPITQWKVNIGELKGKYKYCIEGTIGNTFNSKDNAENIARQFVDNSIRSVICDAARGAGAYKWVMKHVLQAVLDAGANEEAADSLCRRVMEIGWRHTVGRAGTKFARFIAGLVAPGGANYKVVESIVNKMEEVKFPLTEERKREAKVLANLYFNNLISTDINNAIPLVLKEDGQTTNSVHSSTKDEIIQGYEYILTNLYQYFGVPIKFFLSGEPGNWEKYWETPSKKDLEDGKVKYPFEEGKLQKYHSIRGMICESNVDCVDQKNKCTSGACEYSGGGRKLKKKTLRKKSNLKGGKKQKNNSKKRKNNKSNNKKTKNNKKQKKNKKTNKRN